MSLQQRNKTSGILETVAGFTNVDSILSSTSKNAIMNKTVYNALAQKIEKTVTDLVNYYDTSQVYNKAEIRQLIGAINTLTIAVVASLPTTDISATTIYFVGPATGTNTYDEYVYVNNTWVKIGDTDIDLTNYITSSQLTTILQDYYTKSAVDALLDSYYTKTNVDNLLDDKQDTLTFDNTPTAGSSNPVTSSGIKTALDTKQATLTFDNIPTAGSNNPVKSSGIKDAIDARVFSNPNLFDNPWFTVNQRGQSSYTGANAYTVDRWMLRRTAATCTLSVTDDGVIISASDATTKTVFICQYLEENFVKSLNGKALTMSVLKDDGTIVRGTIASFDYQTSVQFFNKNGFVFDYEAYNNKYDFRIMNWTQSDITIRAVKLELGSVSTLAMDTTPNYATELEKCKRYFRSIYIAELLARINDSGANIRFPSMLIDGLRPGSKTVRFKDESNPDFFVRLSGGGTQFNLIWNTDFNLRIDGDTGMNINFALTADGKEKVKDIKDQIVGIWNYSNYIWVSADL